ncbi:Cell death protease [Entophlyctis luteolus]|nr:Cell death protease [Entophlyctis luteolus]
MDGLFLEHGPLIPHANGSVTIRDFAWNNAATVVYVDQPVGTGYSHKGSSGYAHSLETVTESFRGFLQHFFALFSDLVDMNVGKFSSRFPTNAVCQKIYIAGESYAGQYIPYIASNLLFSKSNDEDDIIRKVSLRGLFIGNGWMDPRRQYHSYVDFATENGILSGDYLVSAKKETEICDEHYARQNSPTIKVARCENIMQFILDNSMAVNQANCINMYDIRLHDDGPTGGCGLYSWPPYLEEMKSYLGRAAVKSAVNVPNNGKDEKWTECDRSVGGSLGNSHDTASFTLFPEILAEIPIVLFNGDKDLICNWMGIRDMAGSMSWNGGSGMGVVEDWNLNGVKQGWFQTARNLTVLVKFDASHMVPVDAPEASLDILKRFTTIATEDGSFPSQVDDLDDVDVATSTSNQSFENSGVVVMFIFLVCIGITVVYILLRNRARAHRGKSNERMHEWLELATADEEDEGSAMDDAEFDEMLELGNAGARKSVRQAERGIM